jgi:hypothetical protein
VNNVRVLVQEHAGYNFAEGRKVAVYGGNNLQHHVVLSGRARHNWAPNIIIVVLDVEIQRQRWGVDKTELMDVIT